MKLPNGLTHPFDIRRGVLQGEPQSPLIFNLFINDLVWELYRRGPPPLECGQAKIHILLFADDIILVGDNPSQLQQKIKIAARFFKERGLTVNVGKTQVMVFAKKRSVKHLQTLNFHWDGVKLEIVDGYKYLGVLFTSNCTFTKQADKSKQKAAVALSKVWTICRRGGVPPITTHIKLFNALARSTLLYAAPLWGWGQEDNLEKSQNSFLRKLLRVPPSTPGYFLRLETGSVKITHQVFKSTLDFWIRTLKRPPTALAKMCLQEQLRWNASSSTSNNKYCWATSMVATLRQLREFSADDLLSYETMHNWRNMLIAKHATTLQQQDLDRAKASNFLPMYQYLKTDTERSDYFTHNLPISIVQLIAQLRLNRFSVKTGNHYIKLESQCLLCTCNVPNNVQHYFFDCRPLNSERNAILTAYIDNIPPPDDTEQYNSHQKLVLLLNNLSSKKQYQDVFYFWTKVAHCFDLCV